ncbi:MAG: restriction endonuclease subunit S [Patescibacteria group bacterium]
MAKTATQNDLSAVSGTAQAGWQETTLGEVASSIAYGYTESATKEKIGPKFLRITDIQDDFINWNKVPYCPISENNHQKYKLKIGDVVVARTGNSTGATATIKQDVDAVFASYLIRFSIDPKKADYKFIDFLLRSNFWKGFVGSVKGGSAQGGANAKNFAGFPISLPPLPEQHAIAAVLSSLDNKIESLRKQNQTLEAIAQNIFKRWFVEFKFPGCEKVNMVDSELGEIPEEWKVGKLGDEFEIIMGQSPSGESYNEAKEGMIFFQGRAEFQERFPKTRLYTTEPKRIAEKFDVLVSVRAPVGDINVASEKCCIGRGLGAVRGRYKFYALYKIKSLKEVFDKFETEGTVFGSINKDGFLNIAVVIPKEEIFTQFESVTNPIDKKIFNNYLQIQTLSTLRDTLLPRLMRGEVRVKGF